jgi:hypothetical protein
VLQQLLPSVPEGQHTMNILARWISSNSVLVAFCVVVLGTIAFFLSINSRLIEARDEIDRQIEQEVAQESRMACEKWGMPVGAAAHISCVAELQLIRTNHDNRRRNDDFGF